MYKELEDIYRFVLSDYGKKIKKIIITEKLWVKLCSLDQSPAPEHLKNIFKKIGYIESTHLTLYKDICVMVVNSNGILCIDGDQLI
jgi:hypothetical protein